jgi:hypothetical protein
MVGTIYWVNASCSWSPSWAAHPSSSWNRAKTESPPSQDGEPFCHLIIDGPHPQPIFLNGKNTTQPSCENCRKRIPQWQPLVDQWLEAPDTFLASCPHCGHQQNPASYNWRQSAGSGRLFLFVENIFPNEAIPSPELLKSLEESDKNGVGWSFFYIQDQ